VDDNCGEAETKELERRKERADMSRAPEHEGRVSSRVWLKAVALEQSVEDESRVWELCLWHSDRALNVPGVGVTRLAHIRKVDIIQRTIGLAKVIAIPDIRGGRMR
jgi:hypothetical protein